MKTIKEAHPKIKIGDTLTNKYLEEFKITHIHEYIIQVTSRYNNIHLLTTNDIKEMKLKYNNMKVTKYTIKTNDKNQTATIRIYLNTKLFSKYRTMQEDKQTIEEMQQYKEEDIKNYLRNNNNYYKVK